MKILFVLDDLGYAWFFKDGRIQLEESADIPDNGYDCESLEDGIRLLNEYGYITGERKPNEGR